VNLSLYILKRLVAVIPTLFGITLVSFVLMNMAPGGPVEQALQKLRYSGETGGGGSLSSQNIDTTVTNEVIESLKKQYGYDKPILVRYGLWLKNLASFDFGDSSVHHRPVWDVIKEKFPVSLLFGIVSFFLTYLISIPLGVFKAIKNGTVFDAFSSVLIFLTYAMPSFILAILLIVLFGPSNWDLLPIQGLMSENYADLTTWGKIQDRVSHAILPLVCFTIGDFAALTVLTKNSILEEINKDYIRTAKAKGLENRIVVLKHALRNALMPVATGIGSILGVFFAGALLLETIFNLDGIGLLSFSSVTSRDFNVIMGLLMLQSLAALLGNLLSDIIYVIVDPRVNYESLGN
jgi:microcin C transport system permease protein